MVRKLSSLRGSSAQALQVLGEQVEQPRRTLEEYASLGSDLFTLAATIRTQPALRRVITDVSTPVEAKAALVGDLFEGKVGAPALQVLVTAVGLRWVAGRDLADSLEHLGVVSVVRSVGMRDAARVADELFVVSQMVEQSPALGGALSDPLRSTDDKRALLAELIGERALPATLTLAEQAVVGSFRNFHAAISEYQKVASDTQGEGVALVRTARDLSEAEQTRLGAALSAQYGRPVHLNIEVVPELLGGMRIEIGDDVIDGTVSNRLDGARRKLAG